MIIYYSVAKESKYKKDDDGNYIDCAVAIRVDGKDSKKEEDIINKAKEMRVWLSNQMGMLPFHLNPITKKQFDSFE